MPSPNLSSKNSDPPPKISSPPTPLNNDLSFRSTWQNNIHFTLVLNGSHRFCELYPNSEPFWCRVVFVVQCKFLALKSNSLNSLSNLDKSNRKKKGPFTGLSENGDHNLTLFDMHQYMYQLAASVTHLFLSVVYFVFCVDLEPEINRLRMRCQLVNDNVHYVTTNYHSHTYKWLLSNKRLSFTKQAEGVSSHCNRITFTYISHCDRQIISYFKSLVDIMTLKVGGCWRRD